MGSYNNTCDQCGDSYTTESWEPASCPFCQLQEAIKVITHVARIDDTSVHDVYDYETRTKDAVDVAEEFLEKHNLPRYEL